MVLPSLGVFQIGSSLMLRRHKDIALEGAVGQHLLGRSKPCSQRRPHALVRLVFFREPLFAACGSPVEYRAPDAAAATMCTCPMPYAVAAPAPRFSRPPAGKPTAATCTRPPAREPRSCVLISTNLCLGILSADQSEPVRRHRAGLRPAPYAGASA